MRKRDIKNQRFGRLVAIQSAENDGRRTQWLFKCDCGNKKILDSDPVTRGKISSCGCLKVDVTKKRSLKHGESNRSREYRAWKHAKERCFNVNCERYIHYGGRGITMCAEWKGCFPAFLAHMGRCPPGRSLDRINPNLGYEPGNCRWATWHEQARTRTNNINFHLADGSKVILKDYARLIGVNYKMLHKRLKRAMGNSIS